MNRIIRDKDNIDRAFVEEANRLKAWWSGEQPVELIVQLAHTKRSLSQNAQIHAMFQDMSVHFTMKGKAVSPVKMKALMKMKFLGTEDIVIGETVIKDQLRSTRKLSQGEMSVFISQVMDWCFDHGVPVRNPGDGEYMTKQQESIS